MFHENKEVKGWEVVNECEMEKDIYRTIRKMCVRTCAAKAGVPNELDNSL